MKDAMVPKQLNTMGLPTRNLQHEQLERILPSGHRAVHENTLDPEFPVQLEIERSPWPRRSVKSFHSQLCVAALTGTKNSNFFLQRQVLGLKCLHSACEQTVIVKLKR